ncbi:MAG: DUF4352 domain-containing protein [Paludibacter sp.]
MDNILVLLFLACIILLFIGFFSPRISLFWYKNEERTKIKSAFIYGILTVLFLIFFVSEVDKNVSKLDDTTQSNESKAETINHTDTIIGEQDSAQPVSELKLETSIGKEILVGHFSYIITGFKFKKTVGDEFVSQTADGIYLLINLTIKNVSNETRTLDGSCFYLTDLDDLKFEYSTNGSTALEMSGMQSLFLKECQPRIKTKGVLIFEVPEKGDYYLHLAGNFMESSSVKVLLN